MKLNRRQVIKAGLAASTVYSPWMLGIAQSKPVKIGLLVSGGSNTRDAMSDVIDSVNDKGGIGGRKVEWVIEDDGGNATKGIADFQRMVAREPADELLVILQTADVTPETFGPQGITAELRRLILPYSSGSGDPSLADPKTHPSIFVPSHHANDAITALYQYIKGQKSGAKIALIYGNSVSGKVSIPFAKEQAAKDGIQIVLEEMTPVAVNDAAAAPIVAKIQQANPDFVVMPGYGLSAEPALLKAAKTAGVQSVFMGTGFSTEMAMLRLGGPAADGFISTYPFRFYTEEQLPGIAEIRKVRASKGRDLAYRTTYYIRAWVTGSLYVEAMQRANAAGKLTRAGIVEVMENMGDFTAGGVMRDAKFINHRLPYTKLYRVNVKDQKLDAVGDWINFT